MVKKVVIIDGHPDPGEDRYCHAMADAYARGAAGVGHEIRRIVLAEADLPLLRSKRDWEAGTHLSSSATARMPFVGPSTW